MIKKVLIFILLIITGAGIFGYLQWNKPHSDMNKANVDMSIAANILMKEYDDAKFLNKTIQVTGTIKEVQVENTTTSIKLEAEDPMGDISCELDKYSDQKGKQYKVGDKVTFKGICTGKLMDVVIDRCVSVN